VDDFTGHPRVIVISDIGNEPDDQMSLVRLLLYSNQLDIEALIASTSTWQKTVVHPETMRALIRAYGQVRPNLLLHAQGWPTAEDLDGKVFTGQTTYGMAPVNAGHVSEGAQAIIRAADRQDERPLWISVWGGINTLAEALVRVRSTRSPGEAARFIEKLRVYSISDQDDAGPWIRREFPGLFYIVQPSTATGGEYYYATWTGISGDVYYRNGAGADFTTVTNEWLEANIRAKGPLGKRYPRFAFIMEGDTPSYLNLIDNGLNGYRRPDWGGWGGRYVYRQPYGETHAIWTQGGDLFSRVTSQDTVVGVDGKEHVSDQATIWRWREAFQNDFAARMTWTVADYQHANHAPVVEVNGQGGTSSITIQAEVGRPVVLDASHSHDPDGQRLQRNRGASVAAAAISAGVFLPPTSGVLPVGERLLPAAAGNGPAGDHVGAKRRPARVVAVVLVPGSVSATDWIARAGRFGQARVDGFGNRVMCDGDSVHAVVSTHSAEDRGRAGYRGGFRPRALAAAIRKRAEYGGGAVQLAEFAAEPAAPRDPGFLCGDRVCGGDPVSEEPAGTEAVWRCRGNRSVESCQRTDAGVDDRAAGVLGGRRARGVCDAAGSPCKLGVSNYSGARRIGEPGGPAPGVAGTGGASAMGPVYGFALSIVAVARSAGACGGARVVGDNCG
jgi:hypothetical protein